MWRQIDHMIEPVIINTQAQYIITTNYLIHYISFPLKVSNYLVTMMIRYNNIISSSLQL